MPEFVALSIAPGVVTKPTKSENSSSWREANLIRWKGLKMEPIRGWSALDYTPPSVDVRAVHVWRDNGGIEWTAYLCDGALYVEYEGDLVDISPTPAITAATFGTGGFGDSSYGSGDYGDPRPARPGRREIGPAFTLNNWGENLLAMSSADGRLFEWVPSLPPVAATEVTGSPTGRSFVVTPERHVMIFQADGAQDTFAWCDQEDNTNWDYADITSKAGTYNIQPASPILSAINMGDLGGNLFFTTRRAYLSRYLGLPFVYDQGTEVGEGVTPVSNAAICRTAIGAMWYTESGFFKFDGTVVQPIQCDIWTWIEDNVDNVMARFTAFSLNMVARNEFWLFLPSVGSTRNDRLVIFNYVEGWWSMGKLGRSAGFAGSFSSFPILADGTTIYEHDGSNVYPGAPELPWAESFTLNLQDGAVHGKFKQMKPDVEGSYEPLRYSLAYRDIRTPGNEIYTPQRRLQSNGNVDFDTTGRDFRLRVDYTSPNVLPWTMGEILISAKPKGKK